MYFIVASDRHTVLTDAEGDELSFVTIDWAINTAREISKTNDLTRTMVFVYDGRPAPGKQARVKAYAGRACWLRKCAKCKGTGSGGQPTGWIGLPACDQCSGSGYRDDLDCGR